MDRQIRLMIIGAHADDCENCGGIALKLIRKGHKVKFLTATDGRSGHQTQMGEQIVKRRLEEAKRVSELTGIEYEMQDNWDGFLMAGIGEREKMIRAIRKWKPDIIFTHRPNDYHPDHRSTSVLVQDSTYLLQVPNVCPDTAPLRYMPAVFYMFDRFTKPYPFSKDYVFDISDVFRDKMMMYHQYDSQFYEWLPWVNGVFGDDADKDSVTIPKGDRERFEWLLATCARELEACADTCRSELIKKYGERGKSIKQAEALEKCEYGGRLTDDEMSGIFDF